MKHTYTSRCIVLYIKSLIISAQHDHACCRSGGAQYIYQTGYFNTHKYTFGIVNLLIVCICFVDGAGRVRAGRACTGGSRPAPTRQSPDQRNRSHPFSAPTRAILKNRAFHLPGIHILRHQNAFVAAVPALAWLSVLQGIAVRRP